MRQHQIGPGAGGVQGGVGVCDAEHTCIPLTATRALDRGWLRRFLHWSDTVHVPLHINPPHVLVVGIRRGLPCVTGVTCGWVTCVSHRHIPVILGGGGSNRPPVTLSL